MKIGTAKTKITRALGIQTGDKIKTSYGAKVFEVLTITGPNVTHENFDYFIILDHPEISLVLAEYGIKSRSDQHSFINDIRQVGDRWFTAQNDEIFVERPTRAPVQAKTLFDLIDPPDAPVILPAPALYILNPSVDYRGRPRRAWHCGACGTDFNTTKAARPVKHDCGAGEESLEIFFVEAPAPEDRRSFTSYYCMTLDHTRYEPTAYQPERKMVV